MNYKGIIKKQSFIITASIIVMAIILLGTSYALFTNTNNSDTQVVSSGTLTVSYSGTTITTVGGTDGSGNLLEIEPIDEATVDTQNPYIIKVKNTGTLALKYNVIIYTGETNTLEHSYYSFKYKENGTYTTKAVLTTLPKVDPSKTNMNEIKYKLKSEPYILNPGAEATHEIKLWIDEDSADENVTNKIANVKIAVEGEATDAVPEPQYTIISGDLDTVGSVVKIADEEFYVIGQEDSSHVKLLSKWNLNVGNNTQPGEQGIQNSLAIGWNSDSSTKVNNYYPATVAFSSTNYWHDSANNKAKDEYGGYTYNTSTYRYNDGQGNVVYPYVYDNNASISTYVNNYVTYLNSQGVQVSGRLISLEELITLGCNASTGYCDSSGTHGGTAPEWVYQTIYWLGSANGYNYVWDVGSNGHFYGFTLYDDGYYFGVRPVIILEK